MPVCAPLVRDDLKPERGEVSRSSSQTRSDATNKRDRTIQLCLPASRGLGTTCSARPVASFLSRILRMLEMRLRASCVGLYDRRGEKGVIRKTVEKRDFLHNLEKKNLSKALGRREKRRGRQLCSIFP
jgi:hypothetical protein